ncbi:hypothetical protein MLC59_01930 [Marinobacter bryozoorum]|jgi:hypothetical protein|uniref:hypothetical protein n=1 Tax=Marinobacter bryozoorum TaxID=256324 RepID=UPI002003FBE3|nr:hypothetical protein [Marinobacter bryozoorum]MCK7542929.1 hypothetical protein [Marinobacter bryozoorum]
MKNKLTDLNNHLFAQLERLNDEDLTGDELKEEIERSKAVTGVSKEIVSNARLAFDAEQWKREQGLAKGPAMLELGDDRA